MNSSNHPQLLCERCDEPICEFRKRTIRIYSHEDVLQKQAHQIGKDGYRLRVPCPDCGQDNIIKVRLPGLSEGELDRDD